MKYCPNCGAALRNDMMFCPDCGKKYKDPISDPPKDTPPEPKKIVKWVWIVLAILCAFVIAFLLVHYIRNKAEDEATESEVLSDQGTVASQESDASQETNASQETDAAAKTCSHDWIEATCTEPKTCSICGETEGSALGHAWREATCTEPKTCKVCGETYGQPLGHDWTPASYNAPKTCTVCGATEGDPIPEPASLLDLQQTAKYGKLYIHSSSTPDFTYNDDYNDINTLGYTAYAADATGNIYTCGFHLDGPDAAPYYLEYRLNGKYTTFTAAVGPSSECRSRNGSARYTKQVMIYLDGTLAYTSSTFKATSASDTVELDITGVNSLKIVYAATTGANSLATIFDPIVSCDSCENDGNGNVIVSYGYENDDTITNNNDKSPAVGDIITLGSYEQDNDLSNGKEEIEWRVLAKDGNNVLVVSNKTLDLKEYDRDAYDYDITWENCSLRTWLNSTFLNNAFSSKEQEKILNAIVSSELSAVCGTNPGNAIIDRVFLLSLTEAKKYFSSDEDRYCAGTEYAAARGSWELDIYYGTSEPHIAWWLRTAGSGGESANALCVAYNGAIYNDDVGVDSWNPDIGVRPAMWISIDD